jgi:hypothetical protein
LAQIAEIGFLAANAIEKPVIACNLPSVLNMYYFFDTQNAGAGIHAGVLPEPKGGYHSMLLVVSILA